MLSVGYSWAPGLGVVENRSYWTGGHSWTLQDQSFVPLIKAVFETTGATWGHHLKADDEELTDSFGKSRHSAMSPVVA